METDKLEEKGPHQRLLDIERIRLVLNHRHRDLLLFNILVESGLTVQQVLSLKVAELKPLRKGDTFPIAPNGSPKGQPASIFSQCMAESLHVWLPHARLNDSDYLFRSRKGKKPLSITSVSRLVHGWLKEAKLDSYKGLRDLRKAPKSDSTTVNSLKVSQTQPHSLAVLPKIKNRSIQKRVYQELQNAIISGRIIPGQRLVIDDIARQMGVSPIPVREAIGRLDARGFLTTRHNWGTLVNELSRSKLEEILELRLLLEGQAASKAVTKVTQRSLDKLREAHEAYAAAKQTSDADAHIKYNRNFHMLIYQIAGSPVLLDIIKQLWDRVSPYYHIMVRQLFKPQPTTGVQHHYEILKAMQKRDVVKTRHWLRLDLEMSARYVMELFDSHCFS